MSGLMFVLGVAFGASTVCGCFAWAVLRKGSSIELVDLWWAENGDRWESLRVQLLEERAATSKRSRGV